MKVVAELVIDSNGRHSVWLADALTAANLYASRCHGIVVDCVTTWEADQQAKEAFQRGVAEGIALSQLSGAGTSPCSGQKP